MPYYLVQLAYAKEAIKTLAERPSPWPSQGRRDRPLQDHAAVDVG